MLQHLGMLLAAPDHAVVNAALQTLMAAARKVHSPGARFSGDATLNKRLQSLASGWGGKEQVRLVLTQGNMLESFCWRYC